MSLFDSASLVVTPNGYKEDKLYSIKPTDGSGDLVVTRATTATRVNSAGLIEVVPRNLLQYSEQIENAIYTKINFNITANAIAAPNGTTTADKVIPTTTNSAHVFYQAVPTGVYGFSIYAKAAEETTFSMWLNDLSKRAIFDLTTATITSSNVTNSTITNVGNGWYRCTIYDTTVTSLVAVYARSGNGFAGNNSDGMYFWGAQAEISTTATEYFPTTDRLNVPRLDYTNSSCPSILVEPQRSNIAIYSEQFDNVNWVKDGFTISANATTSPDGTSTADKLVSSASSGNKIAYQIITTSIGSVYTTSAYFKASEYNLAFIRLGGVTGNPYVIYNLSTQAVVSSSGSITHTIQLISNNWYKITATVTATSVIIAPVFSFLPATGYTIDGSNVPQYTGNGVSGGFIWGAQLEAGSYATSYIPTVASSVTRNADVISKTGISSLIGQTEGTMFCEINIPTMANTGANFVSISLFNSALTNYTVFDIYDVGILFANHVNGTLQASIQKNSLTAGVHKIAFAYKNNDFILYVDGNIVGTDTSGTVGIQDSFGFQFGTNQFIGQQFVKQALVFKTRLTNTELAQLTTL